jgi:hypothetical protein
MRRREGPFMFVERNGCSARRGLRQDPCDIEILASSDFCIFLAPLLQLLQIVTSVNNASPMPKRKRGAGQEGPSEEERKTAGVERQIVLGKRELTKSLKLAKGFERQKLGRREKDAKAKKAQDDVAKIEQEITALKVRAYPQHICPGNLLMSHWNTGN